jgi:hypothetical protein
MAPRQQAHPNNRARTGEGGDGQMGHGERPNKSPNYGKMLQATGNRQQATGNRQQATGNRQQATNYSAFLSRVKPQIAQFHPSISFSYSHGKSPDCHALDNTGFFILPVWED